MQAIHGFLWTCSQLNRLIDEGIIRTDRSGFLSYEDLSRLRYEMSPEFEDIKNILDELDRLATGTEALVGKVDLNHRQTRKRLKTIEEKIAKLEERVQELKERHQVLEELS